MLYHSLLWEFNVYLFLNHTLYLYYNPYYYRQILTVVTCHILYWSDVHCWHKVTVSASSSQTFVTLPWSPNICPQMLMYSVYFSFYFIFILVLHTLIFIFHFLYVFFLAAVTSKFSLLKSAKVYLILCAKTVVYYYTSDTWPLTLTLTVKLTLTITADLSIITKP